jgi:hypothetical protein
MKHMIVCLFLWQVLVALEVFIHYIMIEKANTKPIYIQWFIIRGLAAILHGAMCDVGSWGEYLPIFIFQVSTHLTIFDPALNGLRGESFWYVGEDSGWLDKLRKNSPVFQALLYFASWIAGVASTYFILT